MALEGFIVLGIFLIRLCKSLAERIFGDRFLDHYVFSCLVHIVRQAFRDHQYFFGVEYHPNVTYGVSLSPKSQSGLPKTTTWFSGGPDIPNCPHSNSLSSSSCERERVAFGLFPFPVCFFVSLQGLRRVFKLFVSQDVKQGFIVGKETLNTPLET